MINVTRLDTPSILKKAQTPMAEGERETRDAIDFYSVLTNHPKAYKRTGLRGSRIETGYEVYGDKSVRKVLLTMFSGKCAYCESKITTIYNGDIEHFRPKGGHCNASSLPTIKPGYYWLAAEWDNLLFACPFCNQTNTHEITDAGIIKEVVLGKLNQFPLTTENHRLDNSKGEIYFIDNALYLIAFSQEETERLLLNPCLDKNVAKFFKYHDNGAIAVNDGLSAFERNQAETSIRVYALNRYNLVVSRKEKILLIKAQIKRVENAIVNLNRYHGRSYEENTWFEGIMRNEMTILKKFKDHDQEYAGLAKFIIKKYFNDAKFI